MKDYLENNLFEYEGIRNISDTCPIFPYGEGWLTALRTIANFPFGTDLYEIDELIGLKIFIARNPSNVKGDLFHEVHLHSAIWNEDLIELHNRGFITGTNLVTGYEWSLNKHNKMLESGYKEDANGDLRVSLVNPVSNTHFETRIEKPRIEKFVSDFFAEDWDEQYRDEMIADYINNSEKYVLISKALRITDSGLKEILNSSQNIYDLPHIIIDRIEPLIKIKYYDTAIREVAIIFEHSLKEFHSVKDLIGEQLIDFHIKACIAANNNNYNAGIKLYRQELRTINRFIRNEYMHWLKEINESQFNAILHRQSRLALFIKQAITKIDPTRNFWE